MKKRTLIMGIGATVLVAGSATGVAVATGGGDDGDETVSGPQADKATEAALAYTHGGTGQLGGARLGERRHLGGRGDQVRRHDRRRAARRELQAGRHRRRFGERRRPGRVGVTLPHLYSSRPRLRSCVTTPCAASSAFWRLDAAACLARNCSGVIFLFRLASAISSSSERGEAG